MKVQVLKDVSTYEITNHSLKPEDNQYYATMDGVASEYPNGAVFEVYRVDYSDGFKFYMNNADDEVPSYDMQNLRQLIEIEV